VTTDVNWVIEAAKVVTTGVFIFFFFFFFHFCDVVWLLMISKDDLTLSTKKYLRKLSKL
jgi:hypothetical protein